MASGIVEESQSSQEQNQEQQGQITRSKLVQRLLNASSSLPAFLNDLLTTQAVVVAGTEAAAFLVEKGEENAVNLRLVAHLRPDQSDAETRAAAVSAFQNIVRPCVAQGKDGAVEIGLPDDAGELQFCLVTLLRSENQLVAVSAVITRCRDVERARQRLMSMQLVAGYFELFSLRRTSEQSRMIAQSHQHVLQLASAVATAEGFEAAAMNLCNELATRTGATRVSLGWFKGRFIRAKALSHTEKFDKKQELIRQIEQVMEECADQEEVVHYDPTGQSSQNVTRAAQVLSRANGGNIVLSLPLRRGPEIEGALTLEFPAQHRLGDNAAAGLAVAADLLAPQLYDRYQNDRWLIVKAGYSLQDIAKKAIGPKYTLAKIISTALLLAVLVLTFYKPMYRVKAPFEFVPVEKRSLCAPFTGQIKELAIVNGKAVMPGDVVTEGQPLAFMDTFEPRQKFGEAMSKATASEKEASAYRQRGEPDKAAEAEANAAAALQEASLYQYQIEQATIRSPMAGKIIKGDLRDKKGARVDLGTVLFEVADPTQLQVKLLVSDRDIQELQNLVKAKTAEELTGKHIVGYLATAANPADTFGIRVDRIVPQGQAKEQENVFEVYATLDGAQDAWMPGQTGQAKVDIEPRALGWIWTHKFVDYCRLHMWTWF